MRALFMDFPADPQVSAIADQYMFGPAFLVAPILDQGLTSRRVYLPRGADWYDWWTNEKHQGGQWIEASAPIDRMPLFVRAGSIVPLGADIASTATRQALSEIRVYPGADATFTLYDDDGTTNRYKAGDHRMATLRWDDRAGRLAVSGALPTKQDAQALVRIVKAGQGGAPASSGSIR
jgi:alpha-D-xyloside xylohydrolase